MKNLALLLFLIFATNYIKAQQNLIYNGDFEIYDTCPTAHSTPSDLQIEYALGWYSPTLATPDYFNVCSPATNSYTNVSIPNNFIGYQNAYSGNAYVGIYVHVDWINGKEYIQSKLIETLKPHSLYKIEFSVSLADSAQYAIKGIGFYLSESPILTNDFYTLNIAPQFESNFFISDIQNWTTLNTYYLASGNENYITIGCFIDSSKINLLSVNNFTSTGGNTSYYYIDNIKLYEVDISAQYPNVLSPNGDGINDYWAPFIMDEDEKINIYNRWGSLIIELSNENKKWYGKTEKGEDCADGVYYFTTNKNRKGTILLIK
ncbi:MAG: gliding motility-associated C-terminal domain-containing protein [Bacteroidia bacterium]